MNDLENELSRLLADAADRAPRASAGLSATVKARHRRGGRGPPPCSRPRPWSW
ncbi:hypothetical protein ACFQX6_43730 [Streptosporangium lutulentum]